MKKYLLFLLVLLSCSNVNAALLTQNYVPYTCQGGTAPQICNSNFTTDSSGDLLIGSGGNVGIGTSVANAALQVQGTILSNDLIVKGPWLDVRGYGLITFGAAATSGQQTANAAAIQAAVTASQTSHIPVFIPAGTILINIDIISPLSVAIIGAGVNNTTILQTAAGHYVFYLGTTTYPNYTYNYYMEGMKLATASGSYDAVFVGNIIASTFKNVIVTASGRNGWTLKDDQDLTFINCHNDGRIPGPTGQNMVNSSQGVWGARFTTTVASQAASSATTVLLTSAAGMANGQRIHFILNDGTAFRTYITNISTNTVTINDAVPLNKTINAASTAISGYGYGFLITGASTTLSFLDCNADNPWEAVLNQSGGAFINYSGVIQASYGWAFESDGTGGVKVDLNLYLESGTENDAGGVELVAASGGSRVRIQGGDGGGVKLVNSNGVNLTGYINTIDVDAASLNIRGENILYGFAGLGEGTFKDLSKDGSWVNVQRSSSLLTGRKDYRTLTSIFPNKGLERWNGTSIPTGLEATTVAATITKTGVGLGDTTHFDGSYAMKITGGASRPTGVRIFLDPAQVDGKYVTFSGKYQSSVDWIAWYDKSGGAADYTESVMASGAGNWANFTYTAKIDPADSGPQIILSANNPGDVIYIDDFNVSVDSYEYALPQILTVNGTTPNVANGFDAYIPIWKTANTSSTSITNFLGGIGGQIYTFILDVNTTLVNGTNMVLRGGGNISGSGGTNWTMVELLYNSELNKWIQTSYESVN